MAASDWRIDSLISSLKRRGNVPTSSESWTDADFRAIADDEMRTYVVPLLRRVNEEFCVTHYDVATVASQEDYRLPPRATGETLRDVQLDNGSGYSSLTRLSPEDAVTNSTTGDPSAFYLRDDKVVLVPTPSGSGSTLRMRYFIRPNKLVDESEIWEVATKPTPTTFTITALNATGTAVAAFGSTETVDIIRSQPGFRHVIIDGAASIAYGGGTNTVTMTAAEVALVSVGDYFGTAEESCVPQIPAEAHPLLAQAVVCAYLRASGQPGLGEAEAKLGRMEADFRSLVTPRTQANVRYFVNHDGPGWRHRSYGRTR